MLIRHADPDRDGPACAAIYAPYITDSTASFELEPPTAAEFTTRIALLSRTHPYLVVVEDTGEVEIIAGFAYASAHRPRAAYRWACEVSVYLHPGYHRRGIGTALYETLFELLRSQGMQRVCAGITLPNDPSLGLHRSVGFEDVGVYRKIGWKAGAWRDVIWLQRDLVPPVDTPEPPAEPGPPPRLSSPIEI
jgi:L-amino acid N-acyltransferase YncA